MVKLSVAIITYNEEKNIERCLKSIQLVADEIVVVDSFSTDATESICKKYNVIFIPHIFEGHIQQKNYALTQCSSDYVLSLDADEALSETMTQEILKIKSDWKYDGYFFNRLNHYCGKPVKFSGWYPDKSLRLWNKTKGAWGGSNPHDRFIMQPNTTTYYIKEDILHYTFHSIEQHLDQIHKFSTISAKSKFEKGKKSNWIKILLYPIWRFVRGYIVKQGFRDGFTGFIISKNSAFAVYLKYMKLYNLQNHK